MYDKEQQVYDKEQLLLSLSLKRCVVVAVFIEMSGFGMDIVNLYADQFSGLVLSRMLNCLRVDNY